MGANGDPGDASDIAKVSHYLHFFGDQGWGKIFISNLLCKPGSNVSWTIVIRHLERAVITNKSTLLQFCIFFRNGANCLCRVLLDWGRQTHSTVCPNKNLGMLILGMILLITSRLLAGFIP